MMTPYQFENALVAIDGSEGSQRALDCAFSLIGRLGGQADGAIGGGQAARLCRHRR